MYVEQVVESIISGIINGSRAKNVLRSSRVKRKV